MNRLMLMMRKTGLIAPAMHTISAGGIALVIWYGSYLIANHQITVGNFASFITSLVMLYNPLKSIGNNVRGVIMSLMAVERVFDTLGRKSEVQNAENPVTSITDHYISFENDGVQSYLYTGGTVMEYEPLVTFNGSDKTPVQTEKKIIKGDSSNVLGVTSDNNGNKPKPAAANGKDDVPVLVKKPKRPSNNLSFGSGTFVK